MEYNHYKKLDDFKEQLVVIREIGLNPIAVSQIDTEDIFVFEKNEEAEKAYRLLEDIDHCKVVGWWYGKKDFLKAIKEYENQKNENRKVLVYWFNC